MEAALEVADGLVGGADQEVLEALALEQVEHDGGGVGEVVADILFDRALVAGLRPPPWRCWEWTLSSIRSVSSSCSGVPVKMRAIRRLASSTHQRLPVSACASGSI